MPQELGAEAVAREGGALARAFRLASLAGLVLQNSALFITMRHTKTAHADQYSASVAVMVVEVVKLVAAYILYAIELGGGPVAAVRDAASELWASRRDMLLLGVPALCYTLQQNLIFYASGYLSAPAMQATTQSKQPFTAIFAIALLHKKFSLLQWCSFFLMAAGVILVQMQDAKSQSAENRAASDATCYGVPCRFIGVAASVSAAALSGFAGIYLEKQFTARGASLWAKNVHLAIVSMPLQALIILEFDREAIARDGLFHGFHGDTAAVILVQSIGGLLTAVVIKYAGNILKNFAGSLAIATTDCVSMVLFDYSPTPLFWLGTLGLVASATMYNLPADVQQQCTCKAKSTVAARASSVLRERDFRASSESMTELNDAAIDAATAAEKSTGSCRAGSV